MNDDFDPTPVAIGSTLFIAVFILGIFLGSQISAPDQIRVGRNQGIMLCSEKPDQCKIEYQYLKLKENQK